MNAKRIYLIKIAPVVLLAGTAYWLLDCLKITPFTGITCVILTVICCLGSLLYGIKCKNRFPDSLPWKQAALVYREEILLMNTKTEGNTFTKKIGQTVYVVRYHFNEDSKETMQEKINRMLVTEVSRMAMY